MKLERNKCPSMCTFASLSLFQRAITDLVVSVQFLPISSIELDNHSPDKMIANKTSIHLLIRDEETNIWINGVVNILFHFQKARIRSWKHAKLFKGLIWLKFFSRSVYRLSINFVLETQIIREL